METIPDIDNNPVIKTLIKDQAKFPQTFKKNILKHDEMYLFNITNLEGDQERALVEYFSLGRHVLDEVRQIVNWYFGGFEKLPSFLDFASGCGRFMRFLIEEVPPEKIWISDIQPQAVKFQQEYLGVNTILSSTQPEDYKVDYKFDCILSISFFSHMPERTFSKWMKTLYNLLTPEGIFLFSVHDESLLPPHIKMNDKGIFFASESESFALDKEEYGTTYVTENYVRQVLSEISGNHAHIHRLKEGVSRFQDLYIVTNKAVDFSSLNFVHHPEGYLDSVELTAEGKLHLGGWAADFNEGGEIQEIAIFINDKKIDHCLPCHPRHDVAKYFKTDQVLNSGWSFDLDLDKILREDVMMIKVINHAHLESIVEIASIESMLKNDSEAEWFWNTRVKLNQFENDLATTQKDLNETQELLLKAQEQLAKNQNVLTSMQTQLELTQTELSASRSEKKQLEKELSTTQKELDQAMIQLEKVEKSKFWQARNTWFNFKKSVGLIQEEEI